jgi:GNAT superfamily N-acetyltransferase
LYISERLRSEHVLDGFRCGNPLLQRWLLSSALTADRAGTARTFVWRERARVVAYFSLCPHELRRETLPRGLAHGAPHSIPSILLARLALHEDVHGRGLGSQLLVDALTRAVAAVTAAGGRFIVVDAIDEPASDFYEHHGFGRLPGMDQRLVMKATDAARSLGLGLP